MVVFHASLPSQHGMSCHVSETAARKLLTFSISKVS